MLLLAVLAWGGLACSDPAGHELPALPAPSTVDTSRIVSPSYAAPATTSSAVSEVTPPPTPDWRVTPPTVLVAVAPPATSPAPPTQTTSAPGPQPAPPVRPAPGGDGPGHGGHGGHGGGHGHGHGAD